VTQILPATTTTTATTATATTTTAAACFFFFLFGIFPDLHWGGGAGAGSGTVFVKGRVYNQRLDEMGCSCCFCFGGVRLLEAAELALIRGLN